MVSVHQCLLEDRGREAQGRGALGLGLLRGFPYT